MACRPGPGRPRRGPPAPRAGAAAVAVAVVGLAAAVGPGPRAAQAQEPAARADGPLPVVVTLAYLRDVVAAVGGDRVRVDVLARPGEDPHAIDPTPAHTLAVRRAALFVESGVSLELWTDRVLEAAGDPGLRPGQPGHVYAATGIRPLEVPTQAELEGGGHVHGGGNPHVWLDPLNLAIVARNVERALAGLRPADAPLFERNRAAFEAKLHARLWGDELVGVLGAAQLERLHRAGRLRQFLHEKQYKGAPLAALAGGWWRQALDLGELPLVTYHRTWSYLVHAFGLRFVATIEEKPGIAPSPAYLERLVAEAKAAEVRVVAIAPYYPRSRAEGVAERLGGAAVVLPTQPGEVPGSDDVFAQFEQIFGLLAEARARAR